MSGADLSGAQLYDVCFYDTNLSDVNFSHCTVSANKPPKLNWGTRLVADDWCGLKKPDMEKIRTIHDRFAGLSHEDVNLLTRGIEAKQRHAINLMLRLTPENRIQLANAAEHVAYGTSGAAIDLNNLRQNINDTNIPHLTGYLANRDLTSRPSLDGAFIDKANLADANLAGQSLKQAVIHHSNLRGANLNGVNLQDAMIVNADLTGANLENTNLIGTIFINCLLDGTRLDGAVMDGTRLVQSTARNIDLHHGQIRDLLAERSVLDNIQMIGDPRGIYVDGLALYDSLMLNSELNGNVTFGANGIELHGALMIANTNGLIKPATASPETPELGQIRMSPASEFREQRIHLSEDAILGPLRSQIIVTPCHQQESSLFGLVTGPVTPYLQIVEEVSDCHGVLGQIDIADHLRNQIMGYQPLPTPGWQPANAARAGLQIRKN